MAAVSTEATETPHEESLRKRLKIVERRHRVVGEAFGFADLEFAGKIADAGCDRGDEDPARDGVGRVAADDQVRPTLVVRGFTPPKLTASYHHGSQGSSWIDLMARRLASANSSSDSGTRLYPSAKAASMTPRRSAITIAYSAVRMADERLG
jgi:hypothetical protein